MASSVICISEFSHQPSACPSIGCSPVYAEQFSNLRYPYHIILKNFNF